MTSGLKKTLYFAIESKEEMNKALTKNVVLENVSLEPINIKNSISYNIVNIKLLPDEEGVLEMEFDELEGLLMEQSEAYAEALMRKYPSTIILQEKDVVILTDKMENDREERLTAHLNEEQKIIRADLRSFKKKLNLTGTEASFVSNIYDDIIALKIIDEETPIGTQKKSINSVFKDRRYLVELIQHEIEFLQNKVVSHRNKGETPILDADAIAAMNVKAVWPDWKKLANDAREAEDKAAQLAASQKRGRGRPKKTQF